MLHWIQAFLSYRLQKVVIEGEESDGTTNLSSPTGFGAGSDPFYGLH